MEARIARRAREWEGRSGVHALKGMVSSSRLLLLHPSINSSSLKAHSSSGQSELCQWRHPRTHSSELIYPIYRSIRHPNMHYFPILPHSNLRAIPPVSRFSLQVVVGDESEDKELGIKESRT
jgi:hypothetical protein